MLKVLKALDGGDALEQGVDIADVGQFFDAYFIVVVEIPAILGKRLHTFVGEVDVVELVAH